MRSLTMQAASCTSSASKHALSLCAYSQRGMILFIYIFNIKPEM